MESTLRCPVGVVTGMALVVTIACVSPVEWPCDRALRKAFDGTTDVRKLPWLEFDCGPGCAERTVGLPALTSLDCGNAGSCALGGIACCDARFGQYVAEIHIEWLGKGRYRIAKFAGGIPPRGDPGAVGG